MFTYYYILVFIAGLKKASYFYTNDRFRILKYFQNSWNRKLVMDFTLQGKLSLPPV